MYRILSIAAVLMVLSVGSVAHAGDLWHRYDSPGDDTFHRADNRAGGCVGHRYDSPGDDTFGYYEELEGYGPGNGYLEDTDGTDTLDVVAGQDGDWDIMLWLWMTQ